MITIDLMPLPAQRFSVVLNGQNCVILLYTRGEHIYIDLDVDDTPVLRGAICHGGQNVVRFQNAFKGALVFVDQDGAEDPEYYGLGDRWRLCYIEPEELSAE